MSLQGLFDFIAGQGGNNLVALTALLFSIGISIASRRRERELREREIRVEERETRAEQRDDRVEKSTAYLDLEVHSSEAFRFAAEHCEAMRPYESTEAPTPAPKRNCTAAESTRQYYFQCLNLFEVCANFRGSGVVHKEVFASWVSWFHEVLDQWYFRELWLADMRDNYTRDIRNIFDIGVQIYAETSDPEARKAQFYLAVSHAMGNCPVIRDWLTQTREVPQWPAQEHGKLVMIERGGKFA